MEEEPTEEIPDSKDTTEEKPEDDEVCLLCQPALPRERPGIQGSILRECAECRTAVWVAPTGQKIEKEKNAILICVPCGLKRLEKDKDSKIEPVTPEQIEEIKKELRWNALRTFRGKTDTVV